MNPKNLKKIAFIIIVFIWIVGSFEKVNGQQVNTIDFDAVLTSGDDSKKSFEITIQGGTPEYRVYVIDKPFGQNGDIFQEAQRISTYKYKVTDISLSNYYICVEDKDKKITCKRSDNLIKVQ